MPHGQQFLWEFRAANSELIDLWHVRGAIRHEDQGIELIHVTDEEFEASIAAVRQRRDRLIRMRAKMDQANKEARRKLSE